MPGGWCRIGLSGWRFRLSMAFAAVHERYDAAMDMGLERYRLGPFLLESEIPIPELVAVGDAGPDAGQAYVSDVSIRVGQVPERLDDVHNVGFLLFSNYNLPFQVVGVLLLVASIGVVILSKRELK